MSKKEKDDEAVRETPANETSGTETPVCEPVSPEEANPLQDTVEKLTAGLAEQTEQYLRLAAEYDNFRRRSQRERSAAWADAQAEAVLAFLPVYDNLERALKQETADQAYARGVEMTLTQFRDVLEKLGVEEIPAVGETFNPILHNAIMHIEDENLGENIITESFQTGFRLGDKVIRVAMVKVAN